MEKRYNLIDKTNWPDGIWNNEPDEVNWVDCLTKLKCQVLRHKKYGNFWGLVYIPLQFCKDVMRIDWKYEVFGGVRYIKPKDKCLVIGFHLPLLIMKHRKELRFISSSLYHYKDVNFAIKECEKLARQIKLKHLNGVEIFYD